MSIHKNRDKQFTQNYRPISLLPICHKIFEKLIFNSLSIYLANNNVVNPQQPGFRPVDSCDIYKSLDASPSLKVRGIFLDFAKAFDRVSHESLLFKLKRLGLSRKYYDLINSFFRNRPQKNCPMVFHQNGGLSGVNFKDSAFLVCINHLPNGLLSNPKLFADNALKR